MKPINFFVFCFLLIPGLRAFEVESTYKSQPQTNSKKDMVTEIQISNIYPYWIDSYSVFDIQLSKTDDSNVYSLGFNRSLSGETGNRMAYYLRYDFSFGESNFLAMKYIHENWYFLASGLDSIGFEYSSYLAGQYFYTLGYYWKWLRQRWDSRAYSSFQFSGEIESFFVFQIGTKWESNWGSSWILDFNNRDPFHYYSSDNWAVDLRYLQAADQATSYHISLSVRFSGISGLAIYPASTTLSLGYIF